MDLSMSSTMGLTNPSASWAAPARTRRSMGAVRFSLPARSVPAGVAAPVPLHARLARPEGARNAARPRVRRTHGTAQPLPTRPAAAPRPPLSNPALRRTQSAMINTTGVVDLGVPSEVRAPAPAAAPLARALNRAAAASRATVAPTSATSGCGRRSRRSTTPRPKCRRGTWTATP